MDIEDDTTVISSATQRIASNVHVELKRKRAADVNGAVKRYGSGWNDCKHLKEEGLIGESIHGSVLYQSFSPEIYGWPLKVSVEYVRNFERSGLPSRFMYYERGDWKDFCKRDLTALCDSFKTRKSLVELSVDGRRYLVNFLQMFQLNLVTGFLRSVAWIDEHGKCFFPHKLVEGHGLWSINELRDTLDRQQQTVGIDFNAEACVCGVDSIREGLTRQYSDELRSSLANVSLEITSEKPSNPRVGVEADTPAGRVTHDFALLGDKLIKLDPGDQEFAVVRTKFLAGLGILAPYVAIAGVYRDTHTSTSGQARLQTFKKQEEVTRKARGDANVKFAWHGTSKHGVSGIVLHGFGQPKTPKNGATYGVGVYLAPENCSHVSAVYSDVDENGEQHMVLCEVITGNIEQVVPGSEQFHPSSEEYDTGVDDICNPKRHIIWSTHMNTHILPQYIISFKLPAEWHSFIASLRGKQSAGKVLPVARGPRSDCRSTSYQFAVEKVGDAMSSSCMAKRKASGGGKLSHGYCKLGPRSPWMSFPMLFLMMKSKVPLLKMASLHQYYCEFKAGRLARDLLIQKLRAVAGDHMLGDCIKSMQSQVLAAVLMQNHLLDFR